MYIPLGASFTVTALKLAALMLETREDAWAQQRAGLVESAEAVNEVLVSMPSVSLQDYQVNALRCMLGSIKHLAASTDTDIIDTTDLSQNQYVFLAIVAGTFISQSPRGSHHQEFRQC